MAQQEEKAEAGTSLMTRMVKGHKSSELEQAVAWVDGLMVLVVLIF